MKDLIVSLAGLFLVLHVATLNGSAQAKTKDEIIPLVLAQANEFNLDPQMVLAIIQIESGFNTLAVRVEPHINDASTGLMQVLGSVAFWLASEMGYKDHGIPNHKDLLDPEIGIYFGCANLRFLSNYRSVARSEEWVVKSYNGGPGANNSQVKKYWEKYKKAKEGLV